MPDASEAQVSGDETESGRSDCTGLAGHCFGQTLALTRGRQVYFAAAKKTAKELHRNLHSVAWTARLRMMEWGSSFAEAHIGIRDRELNCKSEALAKKSDIKGWTLR